MDDGRLLVLGAAGLAALAAAVKGGGSALRRVAPSVGPSPQDPRRRVPIRPFVDHPKKFGWLGNVDGLEAGEWENDEGPLEWIALADDEGIKAYTPSIPLAIALQRHRPVEPRRGAGSVLFVRGPLEAGEGKPVGWWQIEDEDGTPVAVAGTEARAVLIAQMGPVVPSGSRLRRVGPAPEPERPEPGDFVPRWFVFVEGGELVIALDGSLPPAPKLIGPTTETREIERGLFVRPHADADTWHAMMNPITLIELETVGPRVTRVTVVSPSEASKLKKSETMRFDAVRGRLVHPDHVLAHTPGVEILDAIAAYNARERALRGFRLGKGRGE